ncbi:DegV family protein [Corynebacterium auriscanis]|uniref:DegV family protein n=1 Tax=Corynebacterium auriscanis TaxID=99807 RepID=UPI003CF17542
MTVQVLTDSASCLPIELAAAAGVTVVPIHAGGEGEERTTAGLSAMELTAYYARLLERSGDDGVVALHIAKGLSATWSNGTTAAGVVGDTVETADAVRVIDSESAGMAIGYAALAAAECANKGGSLDEVESTAREALTASRLWLYVHRIDALRKGGRLSTARSLFTSALAFKPVFAISGGKLTLAARSRTQNKAMDRMLNLVVDQVKLASVEVEPDEDPAQVTAPVMRVAVHYADDPEAAASLLARIQVAVQELGDGDIGTEDGPSASSTPTPRRPKNGQNGGETGVEEEDTAKSAVREIVNEVAKSATTFLERVVASRAVQKIAAVVEAESAEPEAAYGATHVVPKVELHLIPMAEAVQVHTGAGAVAVSTVQLAPE